MPWDFVDVLQPAPTVQFVTLNCCDRLPLLNTPAARDRFEQCLEKTQRMYRLELHGYVVMPEHVHLLVTEPERYPLSIVIQTLKQITARRLATTEHAFWMPRYDTVEVPSERKRQERLNAMHANPVRRGLAATPEAWPWSSAGQTSLNQTGYKAAPASKPPVAIRPTDMQITARNMA